MVGGSDKALFSTVRANTVPPVTLSDRPKVKTKRLLKGEPKSSEEKASVSHGT